MVLEKECKPKVEEMFWKEEEIVEEKNSLLNAKERSDHRLRKDRQFSYIYKKGKRKSIDNFTLYYIESKFNNYRIGYSISKKQGKAVKRNLLKRRLKEIVRTNNLPVKKFNFVLFARDGASELDFKQLESQVKNLFQKFYKEEKIEKSL